MFSHNYIDGLPLDQIFAESFEYNITSETKRGPGQNTRRSDREGIFLSTRTWPEHRPIQQHKPGHFWVFVNQRIINKLTPFVSEGQLGSFNLVQNSKDAAGWLLWAEPRNMIGHKLVWQGPESVIFPALRHNTEVVYACGGDLQAVVVRGHITRQDLIQESGMTAEGKFLLDTTNSELPGTSGENILISCTPTTKQHTVKPVGAMPEFCKNRVKLKPLQLEPSSE